MTGNTLTWIVLLVLSVAGLAARDTLGAGTVAVAILLAAAVKCALVGWQFMELRAAHLAWRLALATLVVGILGCVGLLLGTRA